jgi:3-isopropylmalate/(R)-2-methylmalate dehydratase small subunit
MEIFKKVKSKVIPLVMDNVDTDMIIPAQHLTKIDRDSYGENLFQRLREQDSQFVFNDPTYESAQILLTQQNFGCGSSREHAVWALSQAGISVVIAESYSDIFYNNAAKNGLLLISLASEKIASLMKLAEHGDLILTVHLAEQVIITSGDGRINFEYDSFRKECFLTGKDDLDYLLEHTA